MMKSTYKIDKPFVLTLTLAWVLCMTATAQSLYFENPVAFSDTVNSTAEESYPIYSSKDSTLFFVRTLFEGNTGGLSSGQDIWYSKRDTTGNWSIPKNDLMTLNNRGNNAVVGIADSTLYVMNVYTEKEEAKPGLSVTSGADHHWPAPRQIHIPTLDQKQGNYYSLYVAPTEEVVIISMQNESSLGLEDLFVSLKNPETGQWTAPVNLGPTVNTSGFEISPYLSEDKKTLFFSSNGHPGYGNADIFFSTRLDSTWTKWTKPENLGDKINSVAFDAYLTINEENEAFFVSNRFGGSTDIFYARVISEEERANELASRIEGRNNYPLSDTQNSVLDPETEALIEETQRLLEEFKKDQGSGTDINRTKTAKTFASETVHFDLNAYEIKSAAITDLNEAISILKENPGLSVKVIGHADDTGGKDYNLKLSIDRAQAVKQYFIREGIDQDRIITFGKGSTQPLNSNDSLNGRSLNRRVEIEFFTL